VRRVPRGDGGRRGAPRASLAVPKGAGDVLELGATGEGCHRSAFIRTTLETRFHRARGEGAQKAPQVRRGGGTGGGETTGGEGGATSTAGGGGTTTNPTGGTGGETGGAGGTGGACEPNGNTCENAAQGSCAPVDNGCGVLDCAASCGTAPPAGDMTCSPAGECACAPFDVPNPSADAACLNLNGGVARRCIGATPQGVPATCALYAGDTYCCTM